MTESDALRHRREFSERGFTIFRGVLTREQIDQVIALIDRVITPETKTPVVTGHATARRQLNSSEYCIPAVCDLAAAADVLETVGALIGRPFRYWRSAVPTVTFPGKTEGRPGHGAWSGHVDWAGDGNVNTFFVYGIAHLTTVEPGGGGFSVVPGSHRVVANNLADPALTERMMRQDFRNFPGLADPIECTAAAGDILYYHPLLVHGASDNLSRRARKVIHTHYRPVLAPAYEERDRKEIPDRFHPDHLATMDHRIKALIGLA